MEASRFALRLRQRNPWEAMDLGCAILRRWWRPALLAWFAIYVPVALILVLLLSDTMFLAVLLLWALKPLFDRSVLHVLGGAVFGAAPGVWATLRALPRAPGLLASLTVYRFDLARSFNLPIWHLERLRGGAARTRARLLHRKAREHAVWLTVACALIEASVMFSLFGLIDLLTPEPYDRNFGLSALFSNLSQTPAWQAWLNAALYVLAVSIVEPLYVAAGFALYLNRRTQLEAWDLELALRRLNDRVTAVPLGRAAMLAIVCLAASLLVAPDSTRAAEAPRGAAAKHIVEILESKELDQYREVQAWRYTGRGLGLDFGGDRAQTKVDRENLGRFLADLARALLWVLAGGVLAFALYQLARRYRGLWSLSSRSAGAAYQPPRALFGMDIRPESLPDDVAGAAQALIEAGRLREALGLLYRGALSALVHRENIVLILSDTEIDSLQRVQARATPPSAAYFAQLVAAWQETAYADRAPEPQAAGELCRQWRIVFGAREAT